ncbi:hypothetical protein [Paracoccus mutanolyticus]|uniref:hypothetical protein n=1 Tax=Paracoccus mutanolyticus TaxID=1499308 RepID=UPI0011AE8358|nr:hypothetical protein [Paracoccus mutanolyticus]
MVARVSLRDVNRVIDERIQPKRSQSAQPFPSSACNLRLRFDSFSATLEVLNARLDHASERPTAQPPMNSHSVTVH